MIRRILFGLLLCSAVQADDLQLAADISQAKQSVLELNQALHQLEQELLNPATTRIALYLSLRSGQYFEPLSIEIRSDKLTPVQHIYTARELQALRQGAVQPLAMLDAGPGQHNLQVVLRGLDPQGQPQQLELQQSVEKMAGPLLLEFSVQDLPEQRRADLQLQRW